MSRYGQAFKDRAVARLLPPQSAALDDVSRDVGIGVGTLVRWRSDALSKPARDGLDRAQQLAATQALAEPGQARASPQQAQQDRRRIKELERELLRKDRALAETAALLVLSKKVKAIFTMGEAG